MTAIVTPKLDIEHWPANKDTGPMTMLNAMQAETNSANWSDRTKSISTLVAWWASVPSYDPDMEPEGLIRRQDLSPLSKEVLGIAAVHRVRPRGLNWDIPNKAATSQWLDSSQAKTMRQALEIENAGSWWNRCLFEGSEDRYHARTEHLVSALMADHPFVHMANSLNMPLHQLLPMMDDKPSFFLPTPEAPGLPDLC